MNAVPQVVFYALILITAILMMIIRQWLWSADQRFGVQIRFHDLALTPTQLLVGNDATAARRYPLAGLTARVEHTANGRAIILAIDGPSIALVREVPFWKDRQSGARTRVFVQEINIRAFNSARTATAFHEEFHCQPIKASWRGRNGG